MAVTVGGTSITFNNSTVQTTSAFSTATPVINTSALVHSFGVPSGAKQITLNLMVTSFSGGPPTSFIRAKDASGNIITFRRNPSGTTSTSSYIVAHSRYNNTISSITLPPDTDVSSIPYFASSSVAFTGTHAYDLQLIGYVSGLGQYYYMLSGTFNQAFQSGYEINYPRYSYILRSTSEIRSIEVGSSYSVQITAGLTYSA